ncbi:hypothetical protein K2P96_01550, partial [Patescibacteria group bacterium]|nr:hypothetical protein [Patescibacteria group bacterium]
FIRTINLQTGKNWQIQYPQISEQYRWDAIYSLVMPVFDSYKWTGEDFVQVSSFFVGVDKETGDLFKISPTEIWNSDLISRRRTTLEIIAD